MMDSVTRLEVSTESLADSMGSLENTIIEFKTRHERLLAAAREVARTHKEDHCEAHQTLADAVRECEEGL